jgi:DnaJ-class molecular chaperone
MKEDRFKEWLRLHRQASELKRIFAEESKIARTARLHPALRNSECNHYRSNPFSKCKKCSRQRSKMLKVEGLVLCSSCQGYGHYSVFDEQNRLRQTMRAIECVECQGQGCIDPKLPPLTTEGLFLDPYGL